jgi:hypothetical protein
MGIWVPRDTQCYIQLIMRNKQSFVNKLGQIDGKIKAIKVLVTRPQTLQEINRSLDTIDNLLEDLSDMLESEN